MNIYLLEQNIVGGWDTYDSCVVCAESVKDAIKIHPSDFVTHHSNGQWMGTYADGHGTYCQDDGREWVWFRDIDKIKCTKIGQALEKQEKGVICASFNAG